MVPGVRKWQLIYPSLTMARDERGLSGDAFMASPFD